jgi:hypothetical protein
LIVTRPFVFTPAWIGSLAATNLVITRLGRLGPVDGGAVFGGLGVFDAGRLAGGSLGARLGAALDAKVAGGALRSADGLGSGDVDGTADGEDTDVHPAIVKTIAATASARWRRVNMCARP